MDVQCRPRRDGIFPATEFRFTRLGLPIRGFFGVCYDAWDRALSATLASHRTSGALAPETFSDGLGAAKTSAATSPASSEQKINIPLTVILTNLLLPLKLQSNVHLRCTNKLGKNPRNHEMLVQGRDRHCV